MGCNILIMKYMLILLLIFLININRISHSMMTIDKDFLLHFVSYYYFGVRKLPVLTLWEMVFLESIDCCNGTFPDNPFYIRCVINQ